MNDSYVIDLPRDRVECLQASLKSLLNNQNYDRFRLTFVEGKVIVLPLSKPIEIVLDK